MNFLDRLDDELRERLTALGRTRTYPAHSIVFFEGDDGRDVLLVRTGRLKVSITVEDREVVLDVIEPGNIVGEVAAIDEGPRSATATALTATEVVSIPAPAFVAFLESNPGVALILMRYVAGRLRDTSRRQVEYGALDAVGRVCRRLVEMMGRYGVASGTGVRIDGPLTQSDIAAWAGLSREAVVKALQRLRAIGWVATTARTITVLDVAAVTSRAALTPV